LRDRAVFIVSVPGVSNAAQHYQRETIKSIGEMLGMRAEKRCAGMDWFFVTFHISMEWRI
jgi:hypothetical protein